MIAQPKGYQTAAKQSVLEIFRYANAQIEAAPDADSRRAAIAHNGCVLIQAPTGSGKTLMAGMVAEELSLRDSGIKVVWLWFTPFAGLVEQARIAIKKEFNGLRVRDLARERRAHGTRSGDVFVATWAAVAGRRRPSAPGRTATRWCSLDLLVEQWRQDGFKLGVIVDEAHHSFSTGTESVRYYRETLRPEFTLMITATPDDQDAEHFRKSAGIAVLHRVSVSRSMPSVPG